MAFLVQFRDLALIRFEASVATYGADFKSAVTEWLDSLAADCERGDNSLSFNAETFLDRARVRSDWIRKMYFGHIRVRRRSVTLAQSVRARVERMLARCGLIHPPRELRAAQDVFIARNTGAELPDNTPVVVTVFFQVVRSVRPPRIVVLAFRAPR